MESTKCAANENASYLHDRDGGKFLKRLAEMCVEDQGMEKSMELDMGDPIHDIMEIKEHKSHNSIAFNSFQQNSHNSSIEQDVGFDKPKLSDMVCLSTVFERDDKEEDRESMEEEVDKEVVEEAIGHNFAFLLKNQNEDPDRLSDVDNGKDSDSTRRTRIQNIFRLCGNHKELVQQATVSTPRKRRPEDDASIYSSPLSQYKELAAKENHSVEFILLSKPSENSLSSLRVAEREHESKENKKPIGVEAADMMNVYVKWEASKELSGNMIRKMLVLKNSTLSDLRKLTETHLEEANNNQPFIFLLADPLGAPVPKEKEAAVLVSKLPTCNNQLNCHLACLRAAKNTVQWQNQFPFSSLENTLTFHGIEA